MKKVTMDAAIYVVRYLLELVVFWVVFVMLPFWLVGEALQRISAAIFRAVKRATTRKQLGELS